MTIRDWLDLLVVPLALVVIGFLFSVQQDARQQRIEDQRAEAERELAEQRSQDEALQAYLDQMSVLLLERDLRASEEDSEVRTLARARTLTVLERLDPSRKTALMRFLGEADLVGGIGGDLVEGKPGRDPIIELSGADLRGADLTAAVLPFAYLGGANLRSADLTLASLLYAHLGGANLRGADLGGIALDKADLSDADLSDRNLSSALKTTLYGADLSGANLRGAEGITNEELEQQASSLGGSLEGATMPNGQKYEEWLKSKD